MWSRPIVRYDTNKATETDIRSPGRNLQIMKQECQPLNHDGPLIHGLYVLCLIVSCMNYVIVIVVVDYMLVISNILSTLSCIVCVCIRGGP
jgi:hypothetical protein